MSHIRQIHRVLLVKPTIEGAGVRLKRAFGFAEAPTLDPFLLLDDFHSDAPSDYVAGFPWHPHRGIETVTYMISGKVEHGDSIGNSGIIGPGDVQWMTAGGGIIHQEMPRQTNSELWGLQLWVNLPARHKMTRPRYRGITAAEIPEQPVDGGGRVKVIAGSYGGTSGPVSNVAADPVYLDVTLPRGSTFRLGTEPGHTVIAYVLEGRGRFAPGSGEPLEPGRLVQYADGDGVEIGADALGLRFLLISGKPLNEPVAWRGPIVMNTETDLRTAFEEYRNGTFLREDTCGGGQEPASSS